MTNPEINIDDLLQGDEDDFPEVSTTKCRIDCLTTVQAIRRLSAPIAFALTAWTFRRNIRITRK